MLDNDSTPEVPLTPEDRARNGADGTAVLLGDNQHWLIPSSVHATFLNGHRDRMYEQMLSRGSVAMTDIHAVAWTLLNVNYALTPEEAFTLIRSTDNSALTDAVCNSLLGEDDPVRSYSNWVRSSLLCNGIKPEDISPADLPHVLHQLVNTSRAQPIEEYTHIARALEKRRGLLNPN
jgi:hypothetical protein